MKTTSKSVVNKKKKLQTTLGKAPEPPKDGSDEEVDVSHVGRSIETSVHGLRQVVSLLKNATAEVKHYITYECDVMYECRICRTIFRSLANFILHKRKYCKKSYNPAEETKCRNSCCQDSNSNCVSTKNSQNNNTKSKSSTVEKLPPPPAAAAETSRKVRGTKKNISTVLEKLLEKQEQRKDVEKIASTDLSQETEKDYEKVDESNTVALEKIDSTSAGVFQTMFKDMIQASGGIDFMKSEVMELHGIFSNDEAVLGPDGRVHSFAAESAASKQITQKNKLICTICNQKFSTRKTLTYHVKYKHNSTRMVYQCPVCKDQFANAWCVFRHLYKVHRKTCAQIRKMRDDIHASAFRKDQEPSAAKKDAAEEQEPGSGCGDTENQWMKNMESDIDLQMCGGCGKRFERKAALHSHSKMCLQRLTICNTIKEKNMKQALEEARIQKVTKANSCQPKGSEKRKPVLLRKKCAKPAQLESENAINSTPVENVETEIKDEKCSEEEMEINLVDEQSQKKEDIVDREGTQSQEVSKTTVDELGKATEIEDESSEKQQEDVVNKTTGETSVNEEDELGVNNSHTLSGEEVTLDLSMDFEPEYDFLLMGNEHLSTFRSSMSQADICDIIGVPPMKTEPDEIKTEPSTADIDEGQTCAVADNNISNSVAQLFHDDNRCSLSARLDADIETTIKEISLLHHQLTGGDIPTDKPLKRKRANPPEKKVNAKRTSDKTNLECRAEKYVDMRKCLCLPCDIAFSSDCDLMEHISQHFNWYCYQCGKCNYMCYYEDTCLEHVSKEHIDDDPLENAVLPISNWKTLKLSTDFLPIKVDLQSRPTRQRKKSVKTIQIDFLYDLHRNTKQSPKDSVNGTKRVPVTRRNAKKVMQSPQKNERGGKKTSKLLFKKPVKVYTKKTKPVKKGSAIVSSSKD